MEPRAAARGTCQLGHALAGRERLVGAWPMVRAESDRVQDAGACKKENPPRQGANCQLTGGDENQGGRSPNRCYFLANSASIALVSSAASGATPEPKRPTTLPSRPMRNFSKFHFTSPFEFQAVSWVVRYL